MILHLLIASLLYPFFATNKLYLKKQPWPQELTVIFKGRTFEQELVNIFCHCGG
jgi:hypothetical protein